MADQGNTGRNDTQHGSTGNTGRGGGNRGDSNRGGDDRGLEALRRSEDEDVRQRAREALDAGETVGRGMSSPDSTQAPLSAETGEPDERARGDGGAGRDR